ncbi:MAG: GtrA family protein [Microcystaceae cyanobacterium]
MLQEKIKTIINGKIFRFLVIGGFCAGLSLLIMYAFTDLFNLHHLISTVISIIVTNFIGFYLNKYYTFKTKRKLFWREMWKYYSVMISSYLLNLMIMYLLVDIIDIWYLYATMIIIVLLTPYNFLLHKFWSFRQKRKQKLSES